MGVVLVLDADDGGQVDVKSTNQPYQIRSKETKKKKARKVRQRSGDIYTQRRTEVGSIRSDAYKAVCLSTHQ